MPHFFVHGWKTRLFQLTHHPAFLARLTAGIIGGGFLIACGIVAIKGGTEAEGSRQHRLVEGLQGELDKVVNTPRKLAGWLHHLTSELGTKARMLKQPRPSLDEFQATGEVFGFQVREVIKRHLSDAEVRARFDDYVLARLDAKDPRGVKARKRLEAAALTTPPPAFANEFLGDLLAAEGENKEALQAFRRESSGFADAKRSRSRALRLAIALKDVPALREMLANPRVAEAMSPQDQDEAGLLVGDWRLVVKGFLRMVGQHTRPDVLVFALFAGALWYAVFVRCGVRERWRWVRPLPALLAGIASILPTMVLIHWQEAATGLKENGEFLHDLVFYVTGVGLREETAKLALFALFIPWLLRHRTPGKALLTGAFVGLGFALEENRSYFLMSGVANVAIGRLLTANFFHAALTGLAGHALYELVRTKFGSAQQFVVTFVGVVLAHGLYDWVQAAGSSLAAVGDISFFAVVILAVIAQQFFDRLAGLIQPQRAAVSLLSLFLVGLAILVAAGFIIAGGESGNMAAVSAVGVDALSLVPITVFYVRKFGHL